MKRTQDITVPVTTERGAKLLDEPPKFGNVEVIRVGGNYYFRQTGVYWSVVVRADNKSSEAAFAEAIAAKLMT